MAITQETMNCRAAIEDNPEEILAQLKAGDFSEHEVNILKKAVRSRSRWARPTSVEKDILQFADEAAQAIESYECKEVLRPPVSDSETSKGDEP